MGELRQNKALDAEPPLASFLKSTLIGGDQVNAVVRRLENLMANSATIIGVHEVEADEPVHLSELEVDGDVDSFDFAEITQEIANQPRDNWQCAYDEREIESPTAKRRFAFFSLP